MYAVTQAATAAILLLAANTAYNDFPRVLYLLARDYQAPRLFLRLGDRLAFSNGIVVLSLAAAVIYVAFAGETTPLIPLYAVGVFLAFTLSQAGMVVHWRRHRDDAHWRRSMYFNGTGAVMSAVVFITAGVTKFTSGAWVSILDHRTVHPRGARGSAATTTSSPRPPRCTPTRSRYPNHRSRPTPDGARWTRRWAETPKQRTRPGKSTISRSCPVAALDLPGMRALAYGASLEQPLLALHVSPTDEEAERFRDYWHQWGDHLPLEVIISPHRAIVAPMVNYISSLHRQRPELTLTVIMPEIIVRHWWHRSLHNRIAPRLGARCGRSEARRHQRPFHLH